MGVENELFEFLISPVWYIDPIQQNWIISLCYGWYNLAESEMEGNVKVHPSPSA